MQHLFITFCAQVETPIMYSSAGGALATPFKTHARAFDTELQLRIAPELFLKQLVVGGMNKVLYTKTRLCVQQMSCAVASDRVLYCDMCRCTKPPPDSV